MATKREILELLQGHPEGIGLGEIAGELGVKTSAITKAISSLRSEGRLSKDGADYTITEKGQSFLTEDPGSRSSKEEKVRVMPAPSKVSVDDDTAQATNEVRRLKLEIERRRARADLDQMDEKERTSRQSAPTLWDKISDAMDARIIEATLSPHPPSDWMSDPVKFMTLMKELSGGNKEDDTLRQELSQLRQSLADMQNAQSRAQLETYQAQIGATEKKIQSLEAALKEVGKPVIGHTEADILYELGGKALTGIGGEMAGLRHDIREALESGRLQPPRPALRPPAPQAGPKPKDDLKAIERLGRELFVQPGQPPQPLVEIKD